MSSAVRFADHDVRVNLRLATRLRDIADEREHFNLLADRDALVIALFEIEKAEDAIAERADGCELTGAKLILPGKKLQPFDHFIAREDHVVERYTATGTQRGRLGDLPPSGRRATWTGINIFRIACGRIAEVWSEVDAVTRRRQLTDPSK